MQQKCHSYSSGIIKNSRECIFLNIIERLIPYQDSQFRLFCIKILQGDNHLTAGQSHEDNMTTIETTVINFTPPPFIPFTGVKYSIVSWRPFHTFFDSQIFNVF